MLNKQIFDLLGSCAFYFQQGNYFQCKNLLIHVLNLDPKNYDALQMIGIISGLENDHLTALDYFFRAEKINPNNFFLQFNIGKAFSELLNDRNAVKHYKNALKIDNSVPDLWLNFGKSLASLRQYEESIECFNKSIFLNPSNSLAYLNRGNVFYSLRKYDIALENFNAALNIDPSFSEAWLNKGNVFFACENSNDALVCYDKALEIDPLLARAWLDKGNIYFLQKKFDEALFLFDKAISVKSDFALAWLTKGELLSDLKKFDESIISLKNAKNINNKLDFAVGSLLHTKMKICDWVEFNELLDECISLFDLSIPSISPFAFLGLTDKTELLLKCSRLYSDCFFRPSNTYQHDGIFNKRIRVAYFSPDFNNHAVSQLIAEVIESHNRDEFEIFGFYFGSNIDDLLHTRISSAFGSNFFHIDHLSNEDILDLVRSHRIDIAIDLTGYTQNARTILFSERCAPIQISLIGFPGTQGNSFIDYIVADRHVIPDSSISFYSEKIIYMSNCFQPNDSKRYKPQLIKSKKDYGLPDDAFVFCCFNNTFKITPHICDLWIMILNSATNSVLWLLGEDHLSQKNLLNYFSTAGINSSRLIFTQKSDYETYMNKYLLADLFLDTKPFGGGATSSDVLWCGLPLLTVPGESFASRMSLSLLKTLDLNELIAFSDADYVSKACELATDKNLYTAIKDKLLINKERSPLFNGSLYALDLEKQFKFVYQNYIDQLRLNSMANG